MVKLTQTVKKGGCAAKVAAFELRDILGRVSFPKPQESLLINGANFDDAAVYRLTDDLCLVETLDFFTPIVDDPYLFGQIASANALSDVYAMGATPKTALAILAFPLATLENSVAAQILQGAVDTLSKAGADLAGGHSIDDDTLKFGLSVSGLVHPKKIWANSGAKLGDHLILTKALGTGTLMAALKNGRLSAAELGAAFGSMTTLNEIQSHLNSEDLAGIHAATDVTGFGVAGHSYQMAKASGVSLILHASTLPRLEHAELTLAEGILTKAHRTNREYVADDLDIAPEVNDIDRLLFFDPQTSGGLLLAVDPKVSAAIVAKLKSGFSQAAIIGEVAARRMKFLSYGA